MIKLELPYFNFTGKVSGVKTLTNTTKGWKMGKPINNLTKTGKIPKWATIRKRIWRNEAYYNPKNYSSLDLKRMKKGLAPQRFNKKFNKIESKELHHMPPQRKGGLYNVKMLWPEEHANEDEFRKLVKEKFGNAE